MIGSQDLRCRTHARTPEVFLLPWVAAAPLILGGFSLVELFNSLQHRTTGGVGPSVEAPQTTKEELPTEGAIMSDQRTSKSSRIVTMP
jgi:hypothetical protein